MAEMLIWCQWKIRGMDAVLRVFLGLGAFGYENRCPESDIVN